MAWGESLDLKIIRMKLIKNDNIRMKIKGRNWFKIMTNVIYKRDREHTLEYEDRWMIIHRTHLTFTTNHMQVGNVKMFNSICPIQKLIDTTLILLFNHIFIFIFVSIYIFHYFFFESYISIVIITNTM
jgi:hypothetical protein